MPVKELQCFEIFWNQESAGSDQEGDEQVVLLLHFSLELGYCKQKESLSFLHLSRRSPILAGPRPLHGQDLPELCPNVKALTWAVVSRLSLMNLLARRSFQEVNGQKLVQETPKVDLFLQNIMLIEDEGEGVMAEEEKAFLVD